MYRKGVARAVKQEMSPTDQKNQLLKQNSLRPLQFWKLSPLSACSEVLEWLYLHAYQELHWELLRRKICSPKICFLEWGKILPTKNYQLRFMVGVSYLNPPLSGFLRERYFLYFKKQQQQLVSRNTHDGYWELLSMWRPSKLNQHRTRMHSWQHRSTGTDCFKACWS